MKLIFIRHAETQVNVNNVTHKTGDAAGLTQLGLKQAQQLVNFCQHEKVELVFSSPERRAQETAKIIADSLRLNLEVLSCFTERNWGSWEGQSWTEIEKILNGMSLEERFTFVPPQGESWQHMEDRLIECLELVTKQNYRVVAIVTHEGTLRGLMPILLKMPRETSFNYHFNNGGVTVFDYVSGNYFNKTINQEV